EVRVKDEEMNEWEALPVDPSSIPVGSGAQRALSATQGRTRLLAGWLPGNFVHSTGVDGKNYLMFEIEENVTRDSELFLDEHLPQWEMWDLKLHQAWDCTTRWGKVICKVFLKTIEKSDFLTKCHYLNAFAGTDAEEIYRLLSMTTIANHLKPPCKLYELTQSGKKEEICDRLVACILQQLGDAKPTANVKQDLETSIKRQETKPYNLGGTVKSHFAQGCVAPECRAQRGIAKNEPIMKVTPRGWCLKMCAEEIAKKEWAKFMRGASVGAECALSTFGRLAMVEACAFEDPNLGQICEQRGLEFARPGRYNDFDLSKPQGHRRAKYVLDENRPGLLVSTPLCGPWSIIQNVDQRADQQKENLRKKRLKSQRIFENSTRLIEHQVSNLKGSVIAEQPQNSRSWQKTCWKDLRKLLPCEVIADGCACGRRAPDTGELMKKRWKFLTNDKHIWDGKDSLGLTKEAIKKLESYARLAHTNLASSAELPHNGHEVLFDAFSWVRRNTNADAMALAVLGAGSDILYVRLIDEKKMPEQLRQVRAGDLRLWFPWMGRTKVMHYDPAGSAAPDEFREWVESQGIYCLPCAADAHWQIGKVERAIEAFKEALDAFDEMISPDASTSEMFGLQAAARNDLAGVDGFSPLQRYAGRSPTGATANLDDEPNNLPLIGAELQGGMFAKDAQIRRLPRPAHIQTESSDRVQRAEAAKRSSGRRGNRDRCPGESAGADLDEYSVTNPIALATDLVYLAQSSWQGGSTELHPNSY
ncbi:unnamed protein product, partial [Prorocentrum cordatum]